MNYRQLTAHLRRDRYGAFWLTDAIRPAFQHSIIPREGFRIETYAAMDRQIRVPALAAAVSRERLFDVWLDCLVTLGEVVDVVLESSHDSKRVRNLHRECIDLPVLLSQLYDFEELLLHDGCTGIAVLSRNEPIEVQFDEHKLLIIYAENLRPFVRVLEGYGVPRQDDLKLITEAEHMHKTTQQFIQEFELLSARLGVSELAGNVNW